MFIGKLAGANGAGVRRRWRLQGREARRANFKCDRSEGRAQKGGLVQSVLITFESGYELCGVLNIQNGCLQLSSHLQKRLTNLSKLSRNYHLSLRHVRCRR